MPTMRSGSATGKRPQQHGVDDREDRGVGAEADGERQDDGGAEARILDEQADARVHVAERVRPSASRARVAPARDSAAQPP